MKLQPLLYPESFRGQTQSCATENFSSSSRGPQNSGQVQVLKDAENLPKSVRDAEDEDIDGKCRDRRVVLQNYELAQQVEEDTANEVAYPAQSGDLLAHHALTIHRATANHSPNRTRKAIGLIYYREDAREDSKARAAYQSQLLAEMNAKQRI